MFSWKAFDRTKSMLSYLGSKNYSHRGDQHWLKTKPSELLEWVDFLKNDLGFLNLVDVVAKKTDDGFEVIYHLFNMGNHQRLNLDLNVITGEIIPSVENYYMNARWFEIEQSEMLNLKFNFPTTSLLLPSSQKNHPLLESEEKRFVWPQIQQTPLPRLRMNPNKSEKPYVEESYRWEKFDLFSPETNGNFEADICFDPMKVVDLRIQVGLYHQGIERLISHRSARQILSLIDKINYVSAPTYSLTWAKAIEDFLRIRVPERAQAIRIVFLELARICEHLTVLSDICIQLKMNEFSILIDAREKIFELFEKVCGHRQGVGETQIGGVRFDLPPGWVVEYQAVYEIIQKNFFIVHRSLTSQVHFRQHLEGPSLSAQDVLKWGLSGPSMRAAGLNFDLRKSQPFYFYQDIDFDIPVGIFGTAYDRYLVRYEEIYQSFRIISQVLDNLPLGDICLATNEKNSQSDDFGFLYDEMKSDWFYSSLESPNGEAGYSFFLTNHLKFERIKIKTPSFVIAQAMSFLLHGLSRKQIPSAVASLGISRWEIDR